MGAGIAYVSPDACRACLATEFADNVALLTTEDVDKGTTAALLDRRRNPGVPTAFPLTEFADNTVPLNTEDVDRGTMTTPPLLPRNPGVLLLKIDPE